MVCKGWAGERGGWRQQGALTWRQPPETRVCRVDRPRPQAASPRPSTAAATSPPASAPGPLRPTGPPARLPRNLLLDCVGRRVAAVAADLRGEGGCRGGAESPRAQNEHQLCTDKLCQAPRSAKMNPQTESPHPSPRTACRVPKGRCASQSHGCLRRRGTCPVG